MSRCVVLNHFMAYSLRQTCHKYHCQKSLRRERIYFSAQVTVSVPGRKSGWGLKQELEAETMKECCLLAPLKVHVQLAPYIAQGHLPRGSATHSGMGRWSASINDQGKSLLAHPQTNLTRVLPPLRLWSDDSRLTVNSHLGHRVSR